MRVSRASTQRVYRPFKGTIGENSFTLETEEKNNSQIVVRDLKIAFGCFVLMHDVNFTVSKGDVFIIMGGSGCGKSTLLRVMIGLKEPSQGQILYTGTSFWETEPEARNKVMQRFGILYQQGRLVEFHDPGGKCGPAPGGIHQP